MVSDEHFVDVTLACDGIQIKAHKMVLSACSNYFKELFLANPCKHPIVILKDMKFEDLRAIVNFMYKGEVNVSQNQLGALLKTAEVLRVKGLTEVNESDAEKINGGDQRGGGHQEATPLVNGLAAAATGMSSGHPSDSDLGAGDHRIPISEQQLTSSGQGQSAATAAANRKRRKKRIIKREPGSPPSSSKVLLPVAIMGTSLPQQSQHVNVFDDNNHGGMVGEEHLSCLIGSGGESEEEIEIAATLAKRAKEAAVNLAMSLHTPIQMATEHVSTSHANGGGSDQQTMSSSQVNVQPRTPVRRPAHSSHSHVAHNHKSSSDLNPSELGHDDDGFDDNDVGFICFY